MPLRTSTREAVTAPAAQGRRAAPGAVAPSPLPPPRPWASPTERIHRRGTGKAGKEVLYLAASASVPCHAITWLLSDDASNVNGTILPSDGGWSAI